MSEKEPASSIDNPKTPGHVKEATNKAQNDLDKIGDAVIPKDRRRLLMINPATFMSLFTKGLVIHKRFRIMDGVPEDAELMAVFHDMTRNGIMMLVRSDEYDEVPINVPPPVQMLEIQVGIEGATKPKKKARKK